MKRFYLRFRVMLITLALGLASVNFFNWFNDYWYEVPVELPKVESHSPIVVLPKTWGEMQADGISYGCCGGGGLKSKNDFSDKEIRRNKKIKNKTSYSSNESIRKSN